MICYRTGGVEQGDIRTVYHLVLCADTRTVAHLKSRVRDTPTLHYALPQEVKKELLEHHTVWTKFESDGLWMGERFSKSQDGASSH